MAELTEVLHPDESTSYDISQWVTFKLDGEVYGIDVMGVQEVLRVSDIAPVPGAPDYVMGIINLRGTVVSVVDARLRFGLSPAELTDSTRIIIIESENHTIGIMADAVAEVIDVSRDDIDLAPNIGNEDSSRYIHGVVSQNDSLLILIDIARLLSEEEWENFNV